ncbi:RICIN domain-containing protein [Kitasatospora sp. NPDC097605]|uniref:RICIN domain-containing protein n=1 Tax=Kitasatospora sp. NPDC097605 TaxID=3157226 RepID=UPI00332C933F
MTRRPTAPGRRLGAAAAVLTVAGTLGLVAPGTAQASPDRPFQIAGANRSGPGPTEQCLDVTGRRTDDGAPVEQWPCNGGDNQKWYWTDAHELVGVGSGKCLDIPFSSTTEGVQAIIWPCNGGDNQKWTNTLVHHVEMYTLTNVNSGLLLDIRGADLTPGAPAIQWPPNGGFNQRWFYTPWQNGRN